MNEILNPNISSYIRKNTSAEDSVLTELDRETHLNFLMPNMISGHEQGVLLEILSRMKQPQNALEIGTFTGYASICLAKGLAPNGILHTIDKNQELASVNEEFFKKSGLTNQIKCYYGNALEIIETLNVKFDLVFIDADKKNYSKYFNLVFNKLSVGGIIIADNILWKGKVVTSDSSEITNEMRNFNKLVTTNPNMINTIIPIRDGLMIAQKIAD